MFEGFELFFNPLVMTFKMLFVVLLWSAAVYVAVCMILSVATQGWATVKVMWQWAYYKLPITKTMVPDAAIDTFVRHQFDVLFGIFKKHLYIIPITYLITLVYFKRMSHVNTEKRYVRGSQISNRKEFNKKVKKNNDKAVLPFGAFKEKSIVLDLAKVIEKTQYAPHARMVKRHFQHTLRMPRDIEGEHTKIIGRPGTGKTVLLTAIIEELEKTNSKAIILDSKGDLIEMFYNPETDYIFNPFDMRSILIDIFGILKTDMDINAMAASVVPAVKSSSSADPYFNLSARDVFAGVLHSLHYESFTSNEDIWELLSADTKTIESALKGSPRSAMGYKHIEGAEDKTTKSIISVMMGYCKVFQYIKNNEKPFDLNKWVESGTGRIFITNNEQVKETLNPILSMFLDAIIRKLLSMPDDRERDIYFLLSEIGKQNRLNCLTDLLTQGRSKGAKVFLEFQAKSQMVKHYGKEDAETILNSCGTTVILGASDEEAAKKSAESLGEIEYEKIHKTSSMGVSSFKDGVSFSERTQKELLFLPAQILNLPKLNAIVKFANYGIYETKLEWKPRPKKNDIFQMVDHVKLECFNQEEENPLVEEPESDETAAA